MKFGLLKKFTIVLVNTALLVGASATAANAVVAPPAGEELRAFSITSNPADLNDFELNATTAVASNISTVASTNSSGTWDNSVQAYAQGNSSLSAAYSPAHNAVFVLSGNNPAKGLTKIDSAYTQVAFASFTSTSISLNAERAIAVDKSGNAFVAAIVAIECDPVKHGATYCNMSSGGATDNNSNGIYDAGDSYPTVYVSSIWKLNLTTGVMSDVVYPDIFDQATFSGSIMGFAFNPLDDKFYMTDSNKVGKLYEVNVTTGASTLIGNSKNGIAWETLSFDSRGNIYTIANSTTGSTFENSPSSVNNRTSLIKSSLAAWSTAREVIAIPAGGAAKGATAYVKYATAPSTQTPPTSNNPGTSGSTGGTTNTLAPGEQSALGPNAPSTPPTQGSSTTTVGGSAVNTSTTSSDSSDSVTSSNGGTYSSSVTFKDLDGNTTVPLTTNDTIGAEPGSDLSVVGKGFKGRSQVQVYLIDSNGNSTYLGKINTSLFGRVKGKLVVPTTLPSGKYTLQLNGFTKKKQLVKSTNLGMEVVQDDLGSLFFTSDSAIASDETKATIKEMAKSLDAGETVILYGYTSGNPESKFRAANFALAKKRTETIKNLFAAEGVKATIIIEPQGAVTPYGAGGHAKNRRVDVKPTN